MVEQHIDYSKANSPLNREMEGSDMGDAAYFLLSPLSMCEGPVMPAVLFFIVEYRKRLVTNSGFKRLRGFFPIFFFVV